VNPIALAPNTTPGMGLSGFRTSIAVSIFMIVALLSIFVSPLRLLVPFVVAATLWLVLNYPVSALGVVLAFMPFDFMTIALGKFFGLPHMTLISAFDKEIILMVLAFLLWRKNGFKPTAADWFLLICFMGAVIRTAFDGTLAALAFDFAFIISYFVGRVTVLTTKQEQVWSRRALWIVGILSVLGLAEVFIFGAGPRTLLYLAIDSETEGGQLTASFHATGFTGLREAATMVGPNGFGALCMVALIIWWVYSRNPLPAAMIAVGLVCSVTRAAWLGAAVAVPLLAVIMQQRRRLVLYATLALALFAASVPVLGLEDFLFATKTGQDTSADWHRGAILNGLQFAADHPFGAGNGNLGPLAAKEDSNVLIFEATYPAIAAEYGIPTALCFIGFLFSALYLVWRNPSHLGYAAVGILVGIVLVMIVALPLHDRRLAPWTWFPIGLAVRSSISGCKPSSRT
jgi:O-Antigen ligase